MITTDFEPSREALPGTIESAATKTSAHPNHFERTVTELNEYPTAAKLDGEDLLHLYLSKLIESDDQIIKCGVFDHTMFESIDTYCGQKFPEDTIRRCIKEGYKFEVHGIFPDHFTRVAGRLGYATSVPVEFAQNVRIKKNNYIRPKFFDCRTDQNEKVFVVAVNSGRDYVFHYASMLHHVLGIYEHPRAPKLEVVRYPRAEASLHIWTDLKAPIVHAGDIVILGFIEQLQDVFDNDPRFAMVAEIDAEYYTVARFVNLETNSHFSLVGVKFSFWGSISTTIVAQICKLGASEIIYAGKLGTLTSPADIYSRVFVPSHFLIMYHDKVIARVRNLRNNLLEYYPHMATGSHVSVPTVVEEDYVQRKITSSLNITSIDNEVSQMAFAVADHNSKAADTVSFSAIHFASDYIRRPTERNLKVNFDLSNNRSESAYNRKLAILDTIAAKLADYLAGR